MESLIEKIKELIKRILILIERIIGLSLKSNQANLEYQMNIRPWLKEHMVWVDPNSEERNYSNWTEEELNLLNTFYQLFVRGMDCNLDDIYQFSNNLIENASGTIQLEERIAKRIYLAWVAHSLYTEIYSLVPWSIEDYDHEMLKNIFHGDTFYGIRDPQNPHYLYRFRGTPDCPSKIKSILLELGIEGPNRVETIYNLVEFSRQMTHQNGGPSINSNLNHWQYEGFSPILKILSGTTRVNDNRFGFYTHGCSGTTSFYFWCLRSFNIPVIALSNQVSPAHTMPFFITENLAMSHGDDPYNELMKDSSITAVDLLISKRQFDNWFLVDTLTDDERRMNVGMQTRILAFEKLPEPLLKMRCIDLQNSTNNIDGRVYENLSRTYTMEYLDSVNFWNHLDEKINSLGGCNTLF